MGSPLQEPETDIAYLEAGIDRLVYDLYGLTEEEIALVENLFRMRQFYKTYPDRAIVSAMLTQLPWTHHLIILTQSKRDEEREFYLHMAIREKWSKRELERQFRACLFERSMLNPPKVSPPVTQIHDEALSIFKDSYVV